MSLTGNVDNQMLREELQQQQIYVEQHQEVEAQREEENAYRPVLPEELLFAQPHLRANNAAPAPQIEQAPQQQMNRKQQRRAERREERQRRRAERQQRREEAQRQREEEQRQREEERRRREAAERAEQSRREKARQMAEAKIFVDNLVERMKANPIPGEASTDYHGLRPTETFEEKGEFLERVILTHIGDEHQARALLDEAREVTRRAAHYDKMNHDFRFRYNNVPAYIENVLKQDVSRVINDLLIKESIEFSEADHAGKMRKLYSDFETKVFDLLNEEQKAQATSKDMIKGVHAENYAQAIQQLMEQHQLTRDQAQTRYVEEKVREKWGH